MYKKEYIRQEGLYFLDVENVIYHPPLNTGCDDFNLWQPMLKFTEGRDILSKCSAVLISYGVAPTENISHDVISCFCEFSLGMNILVVVNAIEKGKLFKFRRNFFEEIVLWIVVKPDNEINEILKMNGYFPKKKYKKACIYDYDSAFLELLSLDANSGVECVVCINCRKKINSISIPLDFIKLALKTNNGIDISILNERFRWRG